MAKPKKIIKSLFTIFQALKYGGDISEVENYGVIPDTKRIKKNEKSNPKPKQQQQRLSRKLSASDGNLNRKNRGGPPGTNTTFLQKNLDSSMPMPSKSVSDVPKLVAHVIQEASSSSTSTESPMARQPIRVINGSKPSLQSQVLLNTKTSQPFEDLVRDLGMSVRIPKQPIGNRLETLTGRPIRSYSQLRSELKAGQRSFYIYSDEEPTSMNNVNKVVNKGKGDRDKNGQPLAKAVLGKVASNSSFELSSSLEREERRNPRRRSHAPGQNPRATSRLNHHYTSNYDLKE